MGVGGEMELAAERGERQEVGGRWRRRSRGRWELDRHGGRGRVRVGRVHAGGSLGGLFVLYA